MEDKGQSNAPFKKGDRVQHIKNNWGTGTVHEISLSGKSVWVKWDNHEWHGHTQIERLKKVGE